MGGANDAAQHSRYVNARDSCSSAGDRPLCSWIDMERPSFSKAISHGQGAALFSLGNASLTGSGILCVVRRATQGKLRARVRQERGDRGRLPRRADRNGRTSWAAKISTNVNGVVIKKKAAGRFRRLVLTQEQCLVRPAASAAEIRLVARLITTHVLILISVLVSIPVISTVRVVAIPRIRIERFVLRYVPASLV